MKRLLTGMVLRSKRIQFDNPFLGRLNEELVSNYQRH